MRRLAQVIAASALLLTVSACSDDGGSDGTGGEGSPTVAATNAATTLPDRPPPIASDPTPSSAVEVHGVVGVVITTTRTIEIRPTGPQQQYSKIALTPDATIVRAGGGAMTLDDVRPSDRIVAVGEPGDDAGTLISGDITVQQVIQGGAPGGG